MVKIERNGINSLPCDLCKKWNSKIGSWEMNTSWMTEWKPSNGLDPLLREFRCVHCGLSTYALVREKLNG